MVTALGYASYFFICLFSPVQFVAMIRGKNINFGFWPLASLTLGLALLSLSFFFVSVPMYVLVGQYISLTFTVLLLLRVLTTHPPSVQRQSGTLEKYAEATLRDNIFDSSAFFRKVKGKKTGTMKRTPLAHILAWFNGGCPARPTIEPMGSQIQIPSINFQEREPWLRREDFAPCTACGALVFRNTENFVEVAAYDFAFALGRAFESLPPYDNLVHVVRVDYFCKKDKPAYDRVVFTPQRNGETIVEYYKWSKSTLIEMPPVLRQVTESGDQYD